MIDSGISPIAPACPLPALFIVTSIAWSRAILLKLWWMCATVKLVEEN